MRTMTMTRIHRTLAEQEVTARYDQDERVLWLGTSTPWVARRWQRARSAVRVVAMIGGEAASWEVKLPWPGSKARWLKAFSLSLPVVTRKDSSRAPSHSTERLRPSNEHRARVGQVEVTPYAAAEALRMP
jgi:hypothetical protein